MRETAEELTDAKAACARASTAATAAEADAAAAREEAAQACAESEQLLVDNSRLESLAAETERLRVEAVADVDRQIAEACADAQRAAKLEAEEAKRQVGVLAKKLEDELARIQDEQRRTALRELQRACHPDKHRASAAEEEAATDAFQHLAQLAERAGLGGARVSADL